MRPTTPDQRERRRRILIRLVPIVWISCALAHWAQLSLHAYAFGRPWHPWGSLLAVLPWWLTWMVMTPAIVALTDRWPLATAQPGRVLARHFVAGIVICAVHLSLAGLMQWVAAGKALGLSPGNQILRYMGSFALEALVTYAGIAGVLYAIDFARAHRDATLDAAHLAARSAALESAVATARLDALRRQLNPHFLFNTLAAVDGLVADHRPAEAREAVGRLGELLRESLAEQQPLVTVARELELLEHYLFIERMRFGDRLRITLAVAADARALRVPSMLLQPLVENAVRHGVEGSEGPTAIHVSVAVRDASLCIEVRDTGPGFHAPPDGSATRNGIGMANTRDRLQHLFGDRARLTAVNAPDGGAIVTVDLPIDA